MDATISVVCYKSKTLSNGEHPLMLRISKDGKKKYQSLGISVNPKFWDFQKNKPKPKCPNLEYLQKIILDKKLELQKKKLEIKSDQKEYSAATLLEANANLLVAKTVDCFYKEIIAQCEINNKCGNRLVYLNSYNSLKRFTNGKLEIPFNSINVAWLEKYEKWLRSNGNKETTISLMFRTLKEIKNDYRAYITDWYKESVFVGNCCYNDMGDTLYVSQINNGAVGGTPISYEESVSVNVDVNFDDFLTQISALRINYKTYKNVWYTKHKLPFEIFSDTKRECTLLDNSTNIWKYKLDLLYYDGTKKDYTFYLNIENGTISETQDVSPIVGSWVYITDEGYKEIITFYSDNTGRWESVNIHDNTSNSDPFTYTMDDKEDKFIIDFGDNSPETYYYNISDNKMKLMYEDGHVELYTKQ